MNALFSSELVKTLGVHAATMIRETTPRFQTKTIRWRTSRPLHKHEEYVRRCVVSVGEVVAACEQMAHATELLTGYRRSRKAARVPLTRYEYVTYHIENHLIRAISVLDRSLVLVNIVFRLGLRNEDCRFNTIVANERVSHTKTATALRALDKLLKPLRRPRNVVIHYHQHIDPLFESVAPFYVLQKGDMALGGSDPLIMQYSSLIKTLTDQATKKKQRDLAKVNNSVFLVVWTFFQSLETIFATNLEGLRNEVKRG